jgi:transposase
MALLQRLRETRWNPAVNQNLLFSNERFKYRRKFLSQFVLNNQSQLAENLSFCSHFRSRPFRVRNAVRSPWWNARTTDLQSTIWTPSNENLASNDTIDGLNNSWFQSRRTHHDLSKRHTPLTSKYLSNAKYTLGNKAVVRTIKCQIFPSSDQRDLLETAIRAYNVTRSSCVRWIKKRKEFACRLANRKDKINPLFDTLRTLFVINKRRGARNKGANTYFGGQTWMLDVPKEIRVSAVKDVVANLKSCLSNVEGGHQRRFTLKLKLKASHVSFGVEKRLECKKDDDEIELKFDKYFKTKNVSRSFPCAKGQLFKDGTPDAECKVHRDSAGRYFVLLTYDVLKQEETYDVRPVVAGDMGVRKFITTYTTDGECHTLGERCGVRIKRLLDARAKVQSILARKHDILTAHRKHTLKRSYERTGRKIVNLRDELHRKLINWLCTNYSVIILPKLRTKQLVRKESSVLGKQTKTVLMALAIAKFYERLTAKCQVKHVQLIDGDECYTTKGCDHCGLINRIGDSEHFTCVECGREADRDVHSARNIFLKNTVLYQI